MKFDQDLCLNLQSDFGKMNSTLGSVVPLAMFYTDPRDASASRSCSNKWIVWLKFAKSRVVKIVPSPWSNIIGLTVWLESSGVAKKVSMVTDPQKEEGDLIPAAKIIFINITIKGPQLVFWRHENSPQFCQHILQWKKLSSIQIRRSSWSHASFYHITKLYSSNTTPRGVMQPLWSQGVSLF